MADIIEHKIDDREILEYLDRLGKKGSDMTPAMRTIGEIIKTSVVKNFETSGRYSEPGSWRGGLNRWKPLSLATLFAGSKSKFVTPKLGRFIKGKNSVEERFKNRRILIKEGNLMNSINSHATQDSLKVGTNLPYAAIHNFGGQAGRGKKVTIPARPFLVIQDEDMAEIKRVIEKHLQE